MHEGTVTRCRERDLFDLRDRRWAELACVLVFKEADQRRSAVIRLSRRKAVGSQSSQSEIRKSRRQEAASQSVAPPRPPWSWLP
ncbi:hypothetical protein Y032_0011g1579 [Ancylostoma ceylanicum]|uniref:Uncharacterized protein n=1 Tax=Ancylostoma ceylanicum TaxID=53326 RepID=A0A016VGJ9_9BILA|nr:hypothetical protein Y032_0011g1579 [Ancylostoma ceylanicum]